MHLHTPLFVSLYLAHLIPLLSLHFTHIHPHCLMWSNSLLFTELVTTPYPPLTPSLPPSPSLFPPSLPNLLTFSHSPPPSSCPSLPAPNLISQFFSTLHQHIVLYHSLTFLIFIFLLQPCLLRFHSIPCLLFHRLSSLLLTPPCIP